MEKRIIKTHDNAFFEITSNDSKARRVQYLKDDIQSQEVEYFVYLIDETEEFKNGKAIFFNTLKECYFFFIKKLEEDKFSYMDYGFGLKDTFKAYIIQSKKHMF